MIDHNTTASKIKAEFALLKYRQKALRVAMVLFDHVNDALALTDIGTLLGKSTSAPSIAEVNLIIEQMKQIADKFHVSLSPEL